MSLGSRVSPSIFGLMFHGECDVVYLEFQVVCCILMGPGVKRVHVVFLWVENEVVFVWVENEVVCLIPCMYFM